MNTGVTLEPEGTERCVPRSVLINQIRMGRGDEGVNTGVTLEPEGTEQCVPRSVLINKIRMRERG